MPGNVSVVIMPLESIKRVRRKLGLSLAEVGARCGLHREAIARAEREETDPRASTLLAIAKALGVPVCELYGAAGRHERRETRRSRR